MKTRKHDPDLAIRRRLLLAGWLLGALVILGRAVELQVVEGDAWREQAGRQHRKSLAVAAPRGRILDRAGAPLAVSHEVFQVSVAPREVEDPGEVADLLARALDLPGSRVRTALESDRSWVVLPGRYPATVREALRGVQGIYVARELRRAYPNPHLARSLLGTVRDDRGAGGVEEEMEEILRGRPGREILSRDSEGAPIPGEAWLVDPPRSGGDVVLTLDLDLQEIAHEALSDALERTGARAGDLLITDPRTGEILAMVSLREGGTAPALSAINAPYEPGSILKPFTVAGLLAGRRATLADTVDGEGGSWTVAGRTLHDVHAEGRITLGDALRVSSNVGIGKAAQAFAPGEQYRNLRDFGFGTPSGISLPGEAAGTLRKPDDWSRQSQVSLAIGYEISVTPLQMAMAYGALANGGELMEPRLIREVRDAGGRVVERRKPRVVRRVVPAWVTRKLNPILVDVVEDGTGTRARLSTFQVAGKSGTSRAYGPGGGYERGGYFSSFVGFFPADDPQLVVLVKLERPRGAYYGGATAAPVTRATLEAVLSVRRPPLDRRALIRATRAVPDRSGASAGSSSRQLEPAVRFASLPAPRSLASSAPAARGAAVKVEAELSREGVPVPEVKGLPLRTAVRRLHAVGLRVSVPRTGDVIGTEPGQGRRLLPGDTVRILTASVRRE